MRIMCSGRKVTLYGTFDARTTCVVPDASQLAFDSSEVPTHAISAGEFERLAGRGASRKWKTSLRVASAGSCTCTLHEWLQDRARGEPAASDRTLAGPETSRRGPLHNHPVNLLFDLLHDATRVALGTHEEWTDDDRGFLAGVSDPEERDLAASPETMVAKAVCDFSALVHAATRVALDMTETPEGERDAMARAVVTVVEPTLAELYLFEGWHPALFCERLMCLCAWFRIAGGVMSERVFDRILTPTDRIRDCVIDDAYLAANPSDDALRASHGTLTALGVLAGGVARLPPKERTVAMAALGFCMRATVELRITIAADRLANQQHSSVLAMMASVGAPLEVLI